MDTPDIYAYLDYRAFLSTWFDARKAQNPRFSHRLFARLAGQKSPSLLLQVIQRKRNLSEVTAPEFARAMKLDPDETSFFFALVAPEHSAGLHLKALARISRIFKSSVLRERLIGASSAAEMRQIIADEDSKA